MKNLGAELPSSSRILLLLGFASYAASFAFPLMSTVLMTRAGLSSVSVGWVMCAAFLFAAALQPVAGSLLDKGKDALVLGLSAAGVILGLLGIYASDRSQVALIPALVAFIAAFSAVSTAASRIIEGTATDESRGKIALILMGSVNFGFAVSSALAFFFLRTHQTPLLILDAITTLAFIAGLYRFRPAIAVAAPAAVTGALPSGASLGRGAAIAGSFLLFISTAACLSAIPLLYARQGALGIQLAPVMFGICNVVVAVLGIGFAAKINEIPFTYQILASSALFAVGHALVPWVDSQTKNVFVTILWSIAEVFAYPITSRLVFASYPPSEAGKAAGVKSSLMRLAMASTPALAALTVNSAPAVFSAVFGAVPLAAGVLLFFASRRKVSFPSIENPRLSLQNWIQSRFRKSLLLYLNIALALIFSVNAFWILGEKLAQIYDGSQTFISSQTPNLQVYDFTRMNSDLEIFARNKPVSAARMLDSNGLVIGRWSRQPDDDSENGGAGVRLIGSGPRALDFRYNGGLGRLVIRTTEYDRSAAVLGVLEVTVPCFRFLGNMLFSAAALFIVMIMTYLYALRLARLSAKTASAPLEALSKALQAADQADDLAALEISTETAEAHELVQRFRSLGRRLQDAERGRIDAEKRAATGKIASQVAHDIRSPLAALEMAAGDIAQLPEEKRLLMRAAVSRIRDIANSLLKKYRVETAEETEAAAPQLLSTLLDPVVSEKRLQFRGHSGVEIKLLMDASSYGIFSAVQPIEFKRMLSNLLNNAVEALKNGAGLVEVDLSLRGGQAAIIVRDDGVGISPEVLAKLGRMGATHGKAEGSGLGLNHARNCTESWGGSLRMSSEPGKGTAVTVLLPQAEAPAWFVSELSFPAGAVVVILDDDESIHAVWDGRLDAFREKGIEILHFATPNELRRWSGDNPGKRSSAHFLLDYELSGYEDTGLTLASELGIGEQSILVTSRYDEPGILAHCRSLGARMIPKGLAAVVPIRTVEPTSEILRWDAILIDDDDLARATWKIAAARLGKRLRSFRSVSEFLEGCGRIDRSTPVYIDVELGDNVKGDVESLKIHELGFAEIYLATGHGAGKFAGAVHLRGVVGKEPPWSAA